MREIAFAPRDSIEDEGLLASPLRSAVGITLEDLAIPHDGCPLCNGPVGDAAFRRVLVWEDSLWRVTMSLSSEVPGFSYVEPKRHIPHLTELDGDEARTLGVVLGRSARVLREATGTDLVYVYVFGGHIPHLHFHLAPHSPGDPLNAEILARAAPLLPESELRALADRVRTRFASADIGATGPRP